MRRNWMARRVSAQLVVALQIAVVVAPLLTSQAYAQTWIGPGFSIPDNNPIGASSTINISLPNNPTITGMISVTVTTSTAHTWVGDLKAKLTAPNGENVHLFSRVGYPALPFGCSSDLNGSYTFAATGASFAATACASSTVPPGTYVRSSNPAAGGIFFDPDDYSVFAGESINGLWTLNISDHAAGDTGSIASWSLTVDSAIIVEPMTVAPPMVTLGDGPVVIDHCINLEAREYVRVRNAADQTTRILVNGLMRAAGCWSDFWDLLDGNGQPAPVGAYAAEIEALHVCADHPILPFAPVGTGLGHVWEPRGLATTINNGERRIYILDKAGCPGQKVLAFDTNGAFQQEWALPCGWASNQVADPVAMVGDESGKLYVLSRWDSGMRVNVWNAETGAFICEFGRGALGFPGPDSDEDNAVMAYDPGADQILVWAKHGSGNGDDRIFVYQTPCGPLVCEIDPTPNQDAQSLARGLAVDVYGNIWLTSQSFGTLVLSPCPSGEVLTTVPWGGDPAYQRLAIRHGRLVYRRDSSEVAVFDLQGSVLQQFCLSPNYLSIEERFIITPDGQYTYALGKPCGGSNSFLGVRIEDDNSAAARTEAVSIVVAIESANPPLDNPYLDGLQPFPDVLQTGPGTLLTQGIGVTGTPDEGPHVYAPIQVTFSAAPSPEPTAVNVTVSCTDLAGNGQADCPTIASLTGSGAGPYMITLDPPPPPRECITFTFMGAERLQYQVLPGDTNLDNSVNTQDLLFLVQELNNGTANQPTNWARFNIDRSHLSDQPVNTQDLLRLVQLLNGTNATQAFNGATVAPCP